MKIFESKTNVNPRAQTILTLGLCMLSSASFVLYLSVVELEIIAGGLGFVTERFIMYGFLPFLILVPFVRIGKTMRITPLIIGLSISSVMLIFAVLPVMLIIPSMITALLSIFTGHCANKWSKEWNERFDTKFGVI